MDVFIDGYIGKGDFFTEGFSLKSMREAIGTTDEPINLFINSGGGDVTEGFAIYDFLMALPNEVNTTAEGIVGSIATVIFQAGKKGKRKMHANSEFFIHNPYWQPQSPEPMEAKDAQALADALKKSEEKITNFYVNHTEGKTKEEIKTKMAAQTSFSAQEAVDWGFVDEIIGTPIESKKHYAVMAFLNNQTKTNMSDFKAALETFEANLISKVSALFAPKIKAAKLGDLYFEGETLSVGQAVFTDEAMTVPAPDGDYPTDANTFKVKDGKVTEIVEPSADVNAELQKEIDALKASIAEKEAALVNATTEADTLKAQVAEATTAIESVKTEFQNFKSTYITGEGNIKPEFQNYKGGNENKTAMEQAVELLKAKKEKV